MKKYFAIDQGNTVTKVAVIENDRITEIKRAEGRAGILPLLDYIRQNNFSGGILSSVRQDALQVETGGLNLINFDRQTKLFFGVRYKSPETLGFDRLANAAGAIRNFPDRNVLIVDFGTCTTYSLVVDGAFSGGAISPGIVMRFKALNQFTSGLPYIDISREPFNNAVGVSTEESMRAGVEKAGILEVQAMIDQYCSHFSDLHVVITGGNLAFFESHLKNTIFALPNLTLQGLYEIYKYNEL